VLRCCCWVFAAGGGIVLYWVAGMTREVMQQALEYLERHAIIDGIPVRDALRAALSQPDPLFIAPVAAQKWGSLQANGYKMKHLSFERDGEIGTIDAWGKVLWEPDLSLISEGDAPVQEPVAWMYQEYRPAFMGDLQWFDEVQFVQPPNDPERFRNIVPLYASPPQRQPLTHEQRLELLTAFEEWKHDWNAVSILIDIVEAAHGIGDKA
jgi:hypothetical protein